jgi:hypothetical protein
MSLPGDCFTNNYGFPQEKRRRLVVLNPRLWSQLFHLTQNLPNNIDSVNHIFPMKPELLHSNF